MCRERRTKLRRQAEGGTASRPALCGSSQELADGEGDRARVQAGGCRGRCVQSERPGEPDRSVATTARGGKGVLDTAEAERAAGNDSSRSSRVVRRVDVPVGEAQDIPRHVLRRDAGKTRILTIDCVTTAGEIARLNRGGPVRVTRTGVRDVDLAAIQTRGARAAECVAGGKERATAVEHK